MLSFEDYEIGSHMFSSITKLIQSKCGLRFKTGTENGREASLLISGTGAHQDEVFTLAENFNSAYEISQSKTLKAC